MTRLALLDRDGTINVEKHYLSSPEQIELLPRSAEAIRLLKQLGLTVVVVTNQSGIGRGYFDIKTLEQIHKKLSQLLAEQDAVLDGIYACPHRPEDECVCRKPNPGLAQEAAEEFRTSMTSAFVIGDNVGDIEMGKQVGAVTILVRTGYGTQVEAEEMAQPDYVVEDLFDAACLIERLI